MATTFEPFDPTAAPQRVFLTDKAFDSLCQWVDAQRGYDPKVARVLTKPAPWDWEIVEEAG